MNDIQMIPIGDITPYGNNPRNNKDAVDKVAASLCEFGYCLARCSADKRAR